MTVVALGFLLTGLVLGVYAMLYGTERSVQHSVQPTIAPHERHSEHNPAAEPSPTLNLASLAAFAVGFGLTGYLLTRTNDWAWYWQLLVALSAGAAAYGLQSLLIARWAIPGARADHVDERYLLQGTLAHVTESVPAGGRGQLRYVLDDCAYLLPAQAMDGDALETGTDVVIDRVEEGVAYAEPWDAVERRL